MRYHSLPSGLFTNNRKRFAKELKPGALAVFNSNDIMPTSADGTMAFKQQTDIFWLSGIDQEESIVLIFPDSKLPEYREILFVKETNDHIAIWEGAKLTKLQATAVSGVQSVYWLSQFKTIFHQLMSECEYVYLNSNEHLRAIVEVETRDSRFIKWCKDKYPLHNYVRVQPVMHTLRVIKSGEEVKLIREACNITEKGFRRLLGFVKPGVWEYEIEAELVHEFIRNRSKGFAYGPIIASGFNACVLHYVDNDKQCKKNEVILLDVAAEYANYASDMTRCVPVGGQFSKRQKAVYNAVLRVMRGAISLLKAGNNITTYHRNVGELMEEELIKLKLLKLSEVRKQDLKNPLYKKYFMHGTSHYLGLDVHDYGDRDRKFEAGMVLTCEPGIYIRKERLGIRLENNIVITKTGNEDLMSTIPVEADEIEEIMNAR
jgi:Xaa-Pro aminopeptidase